MHDASHTNTFSMDSFLDIVTNVVGLMILMALLVALAFGQFMLELGTPMLHTPPENATAVWLECRGGTLYDLQLDDQFDKAHELLNKDDDLSVEQKKTLIREANLGNDDFQIELEGYTMHRFYPIMIPQWKVSPREDAAGCTIYTDDSEERSFDQLLAENDPQKSFIMFIVRTDSFDAFRSARKIARAKGFEVGWEPMSIDNELITGPGGGIGPQVQ